MFRHLYLWMRDKPEPGDYYDYVARWSEVPWSTGAAHAAVLAALLLACMLFLTLLCAGMAFIHRASMFVRAKCYAQAGCDAAAAVAHFESSSCLAAARLPGQLDADSLTVTHIHQPGTRKPFRRARVDPLAWAWCVQLARSMQQTSSHNVSLLARFLRGEAHAAEDGHPLQDWGAAAACYVRAVDLDAEHPQYAQRLADAAGELNNAQLSGVLDAVYIARGGASGCAAAALGLSDAPGGDSHRCVAVMRFAKVRAGRPAPVCRTC
jgi:hypothetical protein